MGDYNIDLLQYEHSSLSNDFMNMMISKSFLPCILQPTEVADLSATVIDNIFSGVTDCQTVSGNLTTLISDHFIQFLSSRKNIFHTNLVIIMLVTIQILGKKNLFMTSLLLVSLSDLQISVDDHFDYLYEKTSEFVDAHVPKKKVTKKYLRLRSGPWINVRIQGLMSYRDGLFKKMDRHPAPSNKCLYHRLGGPVVSEQRRGKKSYFQEYFEKHKTNVKMLRHGIRSIVKHRQQGPSLSYFSVECEWRLISDPVKMANIFYKYFVNVGCNIDKSISRTKKSALDYLKNKIRILSFLHLSLRKKLKLLFGLFSRNESAGSYSVPIFLLKTLSLYISRPLSSIINQSFETGVFPQELKLGKVNPLHKKKAADLPSNSRPISILSCFSKIIEKMMCEGLYKFLGSFEMLCILRFGFRESHSTSHALLSLPKTIKNQSQVRYGKGPVLKIEQNL